MNKTKVDSLKKQTKIKLKDKSKDTKMFLVSNYYDQLHVNQLNDMEEMDKFLEKYCP